MEIRFRIDMPQATVRSASLVLGSLTLMRDGLQLIVSGGAGDFVSRLDETIQQDTPSTPAPYFGAESLSKVGDFALNQHAWLVLPARERLLLTQAVLQLRPPRGDLQLVALRAGSLEAVLEEQIELVGGFFRTLLESVNSVLKGGEGGELKDRLKEIASVRQPDEARLLGAGMIILAAENLKSSYATQEIRRIEVE